MADSRICAIDGCGKAHDAKGWCKSHYMRWLRHGDPLSGVTPHGAPRAFLENTAFSFEGDDCLIWPYATDGQGYGRVWRDGATHNASRIVCEHEHGPPPTPKHEAAHSCGKGHLGCVNRKHLEWKTPKENQADKLRHGTHGRGERGNNAKLTVAQVLEIRASTKTQRQLAKEYGVSHTQVAQIRSGARWGHLLQAAAEHKSQIEGE